LAVFIKCGHYGLEEVVKSVPVQLGREGIKKVLHIPLSIEEKEKIKG
jgi:malate/lactate dehydrogenase